MWKKLKRDSQTTGDWKKIKQYCRLHCVVPGLMLKKRPPSTAEVEKMHRKGFLEQLIWIMRKVKITGYQFRWSGGNCLVTHRIISKGAPVWQCRSLVFLHKPFSSWVISYSGLKNIRGLTSCILVSLHRVLQPTKQAIVSCGFQAKVSVASYF